MAARRRPPGRRRWLPAGQLLAAAFQAGLQRFHEVGHAGPSLRPRGGDLPPLLPAHFEKAGALVDEDTIAKSVVCGPDVERHIKALRQHAHAGYDHICVHQIGPDQESFFRVYEREVLPKLR